MGKKKKTAEDPDIQWVLDQLDQTDGVTSDEELKKYDYMKDDFIAAIREAGQAKRQIEAVFNLSGIMLYCAATLKKIKALPVQRPMHLRGTHGEDQNQGSEDRLPVVGRIVKPFDNVNLEITSHRTGKGLEIEINLWDTGSDMEIRPFTVGMCDSEGRSIFDPVPVEIGDGAPRFENPTEGLYILNLSWLDRQESICVQFVDHKVQ